VLVGGADVPDGTWVTGWLSATQVIAPETPIVSFGATVTFSPGSCPGHLVIQRCYGRTEVFSSGADTSVYVLDVEGNEEWDPDGGQPDTADQAIVFRIGDTQADQSASSAATWQGATAPLTLTVSSAGAAPEPAANISLLGNEWYLSTTCDGYTATLVLDYSAGDLGDIDEGDIVGVARYDEVDGWVYMPGTVDTSNKQVTVTGVTELSRWRILASTPPLSPAVTATKTDGDLLLDWDPVTQDILLNAIGGVEYAVYRSTSPYFTPGASNLIASPADTEYTDVGAVGDPSTNNYYVVKSVDSGGRASASSNRAGEFDLAIVPGS
jgi:hypothetical protein